MFIQHLIENQNRILCSITSECESRNSTLFEQINSCDTFAQVEQVLLYNIRFISSMLELMRKENKRMEKEFNMDFAKYIGLGTPYEKVIHSLREAKKSLDTYLTIVRERMLADLKKSKTQLNKNRF